MAGGGAGGVGGGTRDTILVPICTVFAVKTRKSR